MRTVYYNQYTIDKTIDYVQWNHLCVNEFISKKMTKTDVAKIIKLRNLSLPKNFKKTIVTLKQRGIKLYILSGGISTFLEYLIPDYNSLFDGVFINRFEYDENGFLADVHPTKYDFENKIRAIEQISKKLNISLDHFMYVGDGKEDLDLFKYFYKKKHS